MREGKRNFHVVKDDASSKFNRKSANSKSEKICGVERRIVRRPKVFKSDDWYEKAASSMAIGAKS